MKNIFEEIMIDEDFDALNNLVRWNGKKRVKDESVAHHSFLVTWFSRILGESIFKDADIKLMITTYAIFHDFDEVFTGDILHPFKYNEINGSKIRKLIKEFCDYKINEKFKDDDPTDKLFRKYLLGEVPAYVKKIVKVADWLSMAFYVRKEIRLGNTDWEDDYKTCLVRLQMALDDCILILDEECGKEGIMFDDKILSNTKYSKF